MEKSHVYLDIAGILIDFNTRYPRYVRERCVKYLATEMRLAQTRPEEILHLESSEKDIILSDVDNVGEKEAELHALAIHLGEQCPPLGRLMIRGVAVECDGKGFLFTAGSGVGKSTHAFLWQKYLGEERVRIIGGDTSVLRFCEDGEILVCGSPWNGKECLDENVQVPLCGICLLTRLENSPLYGITENGPYITVATSGEAHDFLLKQVSIPSDMWRKRRVLGMIEELCSQLPVYSLYITRSRECFMASYQCLI